MTQTSNQSTSSDNTPPREKTETIEKEVIEKNAGGTRRVKRTYRRVITDPEEITFIETGDMIVRGRFDGAAKDEITAISSDLSSIDGLHMKLQDDTILHTRLLVKWLADNTAYVYGVRTENFTEIKGVDY